MRRLSVWVLTGLLLATASAAELRAQTLPYPVPGTARMAWDHVGPTTAAPLARFESQIDTGTWADLGVPTPGNASVCGEAPKPLCSYEAPVPAMTPGSHTLRVRACNASGCSASADVAVLVMVVPVSPSQLRIIIGGGE